MQFKFSDPALDPSANGAIPNEQEPHGVIRAIQGRGIHNDIQSLLDSHIAAVSDEELAFEAMALSKCTSLAWSDVEQ